MKYLLLLLFPLIANATTFNCGDFTADTNLNGEVLSVQIQRNGFTFIKDVERSNGSTIFEMNVPDTARVYYTRFVTAEMMVIELGPKLPPAPTLFEMIVQGSKVRQIRCVSWDSVDNTPWRVLK